MPPTNNWGKTPQTQAEFEAARVADRFFSDVKGRAAGIRELAEAQCFSAVVDGVALLHDAVVLEVGRRNRERVKQLELEGLLTPSDRAAINQAEFRLSR